MQQPISQGCLAEVINGLNGKDSPNIGLIVKVIMYVGDHSQYGRIWRCEAEYGVRGQEGKQGIPDGQLDFAQDWLKRIDPRPSSNSTTKEQTREHDKPVTLDG